MSTTITDRMDGSSTIAGASTDLSAIEALSSTGIAVRTAPETWALRSLVAPAAGITVTFNDGVSGNPTLVLANDLAALEGLASTGIAVRTATDTWAQRQVTVSGTGLSIVNPAGVAGDIAITVNPATLVAAVGTIPVAAAQSDQETATSTTTYVPPGRQQFHPSAAKCWAYITVSTGTPALAASYNITSITDTATGEVTITIGTDFSSAAWCPQVSIERNTTATGSGADTDAGTTRSGTIAAGTITLDCITANGSLADPSSWQFTGFGDQ